MLRPSLLSAYSKSECSSCRACLQAQLSVTAKRQILRSFSKSARSSQVGTGGTNVDLSGENVLCILPFSEPEEYTNELRESIPGLKLTWIDQKVHPLNAWQNDTPLPPGIFQDVTSLMTLRMLPKPEEAPRLRYVHVYSAGTEHLASTPWFAHPEVVMTSSSGCHGPQIAEWVFLTLLAQTHQFKTMLKWQDESRWGYFADHYGRATELRGQRMGILGYGSIGRHIAQAAQGFGMDVIAFTGSEKRTPESRRDTTYFEPGSGDPDGLIPSAWYSGLDKASLHNFLEQDIDVLVVTVPATPQTRKMLGDAEFRILAQKRQAFVSNIGRGEVIDQDALIRYLKNSPGSVEGSLRGAALDVTNPEPLPDNHELWQLPNVTITPHVSGAATGYIRRSVDILGINIGRLQRGETLLNVVNRGRGY
ncbi:hypothetical protein NA57DRAFT_49139 [Rhizodiscina lignyota]|uniref:D-isomer specific 2-hydroxyacid dehydrogenase NAD-binding domain-containing protein n=1 Tax=Rhizodiscina lignyota TaxID=1504668 RepID=A0A9P4I631_9PEZI|nr:hypothetical protein NA57DRAFT_49139 [Rhizodiscina lignyota]